MPALLALFIIAGAVWLVVVRAGILPGAAREPMDSVSQFARAMTALDPNAAPARRQTVMARPRSVAPRLPSGTVRPLPPGR